MEKTIYFKRTKIIKVNDIRFPVSKSSIIGNYSTKKRRYGITEYNQS